MSALLELAARCEAATGPDRALNREIALAAGWHRYSPSEIGKSNPGWIHPDDFIGENTGKDGRRTPILDSLHGTSIWREPIDYTASLDAAMTLVPEGFDWIIGRTNDGLTIHACCGVRDMRFGNTPALALCAAALRARATGEQP